MWTKILQRTSSMLSGQAARRRSALPEDAQSYCDWQSLSRVPTVLTIFALLLVGTVSALNGTEMKNMQTKQNEQMEQMIAHLTTLDSSFAKLQEAVKVNQTKEMKSVSASMITLKNSLGKLQEAIQVNKPKEVNSVLQKEFEQIARSNAWGSQESVSGHGSDFRATGPVRRCLSNWISKYSIKVFLDLPCGDGNWQGAIYGIENVEYWGFDISETAVQRAQKKNKNKPSMHYRGTFDITSAVPMRADLLMMRDVIQHLPLDPALRALKNAKKAGIKWLAVSTYPGATNRNIPAGDLYANNMQAAPFNLGKEVEDCPNYSPQTLIEQYWIQNARFRLFDLQKWEG